MPATVLLDGGLLGLAIAMLVVAVAPTRSKTRRDQQRRRR